MPAVSKKQQQFIGAEQLEEFTITKHKGLPKRAKSKK